MLPRVLVTGANGFLGRHLVAELLRRGYPVRALVRPGGASSFAQPPRPALPVEVCELDLSQSAPKAQLAEVAAGCGALIHAAALAQVNPARSPAVWATNLGGPAQALRLARRAGVARLVYVGTANAFGFGPQARLGAGRALRPRLRGPQARHY